MSLVRIQVRVLVLLPGLPELGEFAVQHVRGGGDGRDGWFGEQRGQRRPVILLSREGETLWKVRRWPRNITHRDWAAPLGRPGPGPGPGPHGREGAVPCCCPDRIAAGEFLAFPDRQTVPPPLRSCCLWRTPCLWGQVHT